MDNHNMWEQHQNNQREAEIIFWGMIFFAVFTLLGLILLIVAS